MNTAIPYGLGFAVLTLILWRWNRPREAEGVATMTLGLIAFAPFVAWSPHWPAAGLVIWTAASFRLHFLAERGYFTHLIPLIGYAMAAGYLTHMVDSPFTLPPFMRLWQTWALNLMGLAMVALIAGRPASDLIGSSFSQFSALASRARIRRAVRSRSVDNAAAGAGVAATHEEAGL